MSEEFPTLCQTVLDTTDVRGLAEFYRRLLGYRYRPGDESGDQDWLVLRAADGRMALAFQEVEELEPATWPEGQRPQQLHLDMTVPDAEALDRQHRKALDLGATLLLDRADDEEEPLRVYADPAGHPFCIFVG
jgi:hypothetical protein